MCPHPEIMWRDEKHMARTDKVRSGQQRSKPDPGRACLGLVRSTHISRMLISTPNSPGLGQSAAALRQGALAALVKHSGFRRACFVFHQFVCPVSRRHKHSEVSLSFGTLCFLFVCLFWFYSSLDSFSAYWFWGMECWMEWKSAVILGVLVNPARQMCIIKKTKKQK